MLSLFIKYQIIAVLKQYYLDFLIPVWRDHSLWVKNLGMVILNQTLNFHIFDTLEQNMWGLTTL